MIIHPTRGTMSSVAVQRLGVTRVVTRVGVAEESRLEGSGGRIEATQSHEERQ